VQATPTHASSATGATKSRPPRRLSYAQRRNLKRELRELRHLQEHPGRMPEMRIHSERATLLMSDHRFLDWLAGFIDGEGSFNIQRQTNCQSWRVTFAIDLRADDTPILTEIHSRLAIGRIYQRNGSGNAKQQIRWRVSSRHDCLTLRAILLEHPLRAKKASDFTIWSEALDAWCIRDFDAMERLRDELHRARRFESAGIQRQPRAPELQLHLEGSRTPRGATTEACHPA
jgi:hypothetical protein